MFQPFAKHAIEYNDNDLSIIPCGKDNGKIALVKWRQYQQECADLSVFDSWVNKFSTKNIGLITGRLNCITVVDCDNPNISLAELQQEYGETPLIVETPRGGKHLYYKYDGEYSQSGFSDKIDIRADGGYVIAPYSMNPENGKFYRIIKGSLENIRDLPKTTHPSLPKHSSNFHARKNHDSTHVAPHTGKILEGERNHYLFKITKNYAATVDTLEKISNYAKEKNKKDLSSPLPDSEISQIVQSVWKYKQENRLRVSGKQYISVDADKFETLCKDPRSLALYMLLLKHHKNTRENFTIIHEKVSEILGCERKTIPKCIDDLIEKKIIKRVHISKGKNDGHKYSFC